MRPEWIDGPEAFAAESTPEPADRQNQPLETGAGAGVGRALVERATAEAATLGITTLYLHTETARPFSERLGWTDVLAEEYAGLPTVIMTITPGVLR